MMKRTVESIAAKMDALGLWKALSSYNWAVKPAGTVLPYFCTILLGDDRPVRARLLMLEGWQTLHDFVRTRADRNFGFYSTPIEFPHLELVLLADGGAKVFRHDPGFMPVEASEAQKEFAARILWESYGVMLRVEADPKLPLRFADEKAMFARVEGPVGTWRDEPLPIPAPRPHVERVSLSKEVLRLAKDRPFAADEVLSVDFRMLPNVMTREPRPRCVYQLLAVDAKTRAQVLDRRVSVMPDGGLRGMWEALPGEFLRALAEHGRLPGEVRVVSGRVFRLFRPLCLEIPFKLSLHDALPELDV